MKVEKKPVSLFSTVRLGKGAVSLEPIDYLSLFTIPQGQFMPCWPKAVCSSCGSQQYLEPLTAKHTNIMKAGEFGSAIGDVKLSRVRAVLSAPVPVDARLRLEICGKQEFEVPLEQVLNGLDLDEVFAARSDTFQVKLYVLKPVESDVYVRVEFEGTAFKDVR